MFSCELKFNCEILQKCFSKKNYRKIFRTRFFFKKSMGKINPIELRKTKCGICNFESGFGSSKDFAIE